MLIVVLPRWLSQLAIVLLIALFGGVALTSTGYAASSACLAVNEDWGNFSLAGGEYNGDPGLEYSGFEDGESISFSATASGNNDTFDDFASLFLLIDGSPEYYVSSMLGDPHTDSGSFPVDENTALTVFASVPSGGGHYATGFVKCLSPDAPAPSSDATLSGLALSDGTLHPAFASGTTSYTATVANGVDEITVTPTATDDAGAAISVEGESVASGNTSMPIALVTGANTVTVQVAAQDGTTTETYTVMVTRKAATVIKLAPSAGRLPAGVVGTAYSQTFTASGGSGRYDFSLSGDDPAGLTLNASSGVLSGTPEVAGTSNFTIIATDNANPASTVSMAYTLQVSPAAVTIVLDPADGALPEAMAGEDYSASISASGGADPLLYKVALGTLPKGVVLNVSTGELTGSLDADTEGEYTFTVEVRDANGSTGTATYTLEVTERVVSVRDKEIEVPEGEMPGNVDLTAGATGGPFVDGDIVSVVPANAGTAEIVYARYAQGGGPTPLEFYLKFTPNPGFSGKAQVNYQLVSALGTSNVGAVIYTLTYDAAAVVSEIDGLVHDFVQTRSGLIATNIKVPGLVQRRRMEAGMEPVTWSLSPLSNGLALNFAASTTQVNAALNAADGLLDVEPDPFNIWADATLQVHNRGEDSHRWGTFAMVSAGADYLITDKALVGISFHYDRMTDPLETDASLSGDGWLAGPYASIELGEGVFWDTSLLYGGSSNRIDTQFWDGTFDTQRWLFDTSISGVWQLDETTTLTPSLRASYLSETVLDYEVANAPGDTLEIEGFTAEQFRIGLGAELAHSFTLDDGAILTPSLGLTGGFTGLDGSGAFGRISAGATLNIPDAFTIDAGLSFSADASGRNSAGARIGISGQFC